MSSLYSQINFTGENLALIDAVDRVKTLPFYTQMGVLALMFGLEPEVMIQENNWSGQEARDIWKVKHRASVEAEIKALTKVIPINVANVLAMAEAAYVQRNLTNMGAMFWWLNGLKGKKLALEVLRVDNVANDQDLEGNDIQKYSEDIIVQVTDSMSNILYAGYREELIAARGPMFNPALALSVEEAISKEMEKKPEIMGLVSLPGLRSTLNSIYRTWHTLVFDRAGTDDLGASLYAIDQILPMILPVNKSIAVEDKNRAAEILRGLSRWKV